MKDQQPFTADLGGGGHLELPFYRKGIGENLSKRRKIGLSIPVELGANKRVKTLLWINIMGIEELIGTHIVRLTAFEKALVAGKAEEFNPGSRGDGRSQNARVAHHAGTEVT